MLTNPPPPLRFQHDVQKECWNLQSVINLFQYFWHICIYLQYWQRYIFCKNCEMDQLSSGSYNVHKFTSSSSQYYHLFFFYFGRFLFFYFSILVIFYFGRFPFWSFSILVVFYLGSSFLFWSENPFLHNNGKMEVISKQYVIDMNGTLFSIKGT